MKAIKKRTTIMLVILFFTFFMFNWNLSLNVFAEKVNKNLIKNNIDTQSSYETKEDTIASIKGNDFNTYSEATSNDIEYTDLWGLNGEHGINAPNAWEMTTGSREVRVGIIDTGIASHEDLVDNLVEGYDFFNEDNITTDDSLGHGTHVAGIIGAIGNNNKGIKGVNWNVSLISLQASNANNQFNEQDVIEAFEYANEHGIDIINYSVGGFGYRPRIREAIREFPGLVVWAAGNNNAYLDDFYDIESYNLDNLISVGAYNTDGQRWTYNNGQGSNYGDAINIFAPGENILSTVPLSVNSTGYMYDSGTSMAAPFVSGVAALMLSANPNLSAAELKTAILESADNKIIQHENNKTEIKALNAFNAVQSIELPFTFANIEDDITITGFKQGIEIPSVIEIPKFVNYNDEFRTVTKIGFNAFQNCTSITEIYIPETVTNIGSNAFCGCTSLQSVTFASGSQLTSIGQNAFTGCTSLTSIKIPASVTTIGNQVFYNCNNLEKVVIYNQNNVVQIGTSCFVSTPNNLKIYVSNELFDDYLASPYWDAYEGKLEVAYFDEFGTYICGDDVETISMEDYVYYETLYVTGTEEDGFLTDEMAIIGFNLSEYYAHCYLDYFSTTVYSCRLIIEVEEQSGTVIVLDDEGSFVCEGEIENGTLSIPFTEIWNDSGEFYIFPEEGSDEIIEFVAEDVFLEVTYKEYL